MQGCAVVVEANQLEYGQKAHINVSSARSGCFLQAEMMEVHTHARVQPSLLPVAHTMWSETFGVYYMEGCLFGSLSARAAPWAGPRGIGARGIQVSDFVLWPRRICLCCSLWALSSLREQVHASIEQCLNIWAPACRNLRPCSDSQGLAKAKP